MKHRHVRFALILAAAAVAGALLGARHFARSNECTDGPARRIVVWNGAMRSSVKAGLGGVPWTTRVIDGFDTASGRWEQSYVGACKAKNAAALACLDRELDGIRLLATRLAGQSDGHAMPDAPAGQPASTLDAATRLAAPEAVANLLTACGEPAPLAQARAALVEATRDLAAGAPDEALAVLDPARDTAIGIFGDRHPEIAAFDDALADIDRARGKIRAALALHDQSEQIRTAAFGEDDAAVATSLYHRALTLLEGGELGKAEKALHRAIAIRTKTGGELGALYGALAACDLARGDRDEAHAIKAAELGYVPPIGVAAHDANGFATILANLSNEPNRTALAATLGLAQCDDPRAGQAARTAVSLFLAMPELDRAALPLAQELAKKP